MNPDFHYNRMLGIGIRAGMSEEDVVKFAYSSQMVDDNHSSVGVKLPSGNFFYNRISQTMNVFAGDRTRSEIYPIFHFLPGESGKASVRKDGKMHKMCVTPGSVLCGQVMSAALETGDIYRIGIAAHVCCDTWAHQNFIGEWDEFNGMEKWTPDIGHADAGENPDITGLKWEDNRLIKPDIDNAIRFNEAETWISKKLNASLKPADKVIFEEYDKGKWFDSAVKTNLVTHQINKTTTLEKRYSFREGFEDSDWYRFQCAIYGHAEFVTSCLKEKGLI